VRAGNTQDSATASASGVGFRSERGPLLVALMLSTSLVAIDSTIIATAVPSIVSSIGGFSEFPWLFSIYLLAQAVTVPVYAKLADLFGRKPIILVGIGLFLVASILCGFATNMVMLIAFRAVQGLGAGAVQPMSMTIVGDIYTLSERARVQGYLASVWGASSVVGPTLGGVFSEYISWRWIFFINIPLCLLAGAMIRRRLHENVERSRVHIDYRGAMLLTTGLTLMILGLLEGGQSWAWWSVPSAVILVGGVAILIIFYLYERTEATPILPLWVFRRRLLVTSSLISGGVGAAVIGLSSYVPSYLQDVIGVGPVLAGFALAALTLGWPLSASQAGRIYLPYGFKHCAMAGAVLLLIGSGLLLPLGRHSNVPEVAVACFVIGLGMGFMAAPTMIASQASVEWNQRGVVTGNNMFFRSMGSAVGVAVFGAIANRSLGAHADVGPDGHVNPDLLTHAVHHVFIAVGVLAVLIAIVVMLLPYDSRGGDSRGGDSRGAASEPSGDDYRIE